MDSTPYKGKIFCIGFQKTGTTSLEKALEILDYSGTSVRHDLLPTLEKGNVSLAIEIAKQFDAVRDNPWPLLYPQLDQAFPESKFIYTWRDETSWLKSVINHFGSTPSRMNAYVYGSAFPLHHEDDYLHRYRTHRDEVTAYFRHRPDDILYLQLDRGDGWELLAPFLGHAIPDQPFPHYNRGAYTASEKAKKFFTKNVANRWKDWISRFSE